MLISLTRTGSVAWAGIIGGQPKPPDTEPNGVFG